MTFDVMHSFRVVFVAVASEPGVFIALMYTVSQLAKLELYDVCRAEFASDAGVGGMT